MQSGTPVQSVESNQDLVTVHLKNASLRAILQEIGRQGKLRITYPDALVDRYKNINVQLSKVAAESALAHVLATTELTYVQIAPNQIAIVRKGTENRDSTLRELGSINGRVLDSATQKGVHGAIVTVVGVKRSIKTQADGSFQFGDLPVGQHTVVVKILGYQSKHISIDVQPGKTSKTTIVIQQASTTLTEVVTTATGQHRSYEVGSDITRINVDEVRKSGDIATVADLLATRVPGMVVQSGGGDAGAGTRIRVRGIHSISLSNDPILIIDGMRVQTIGQDGGLSSRLNDIDPASIETIEVFKGASAATLYGPDAANGVIVITKKRGLAGETRWTIDATSRMAEIPREFPGQKTVWGKSLESNESVPCTASTIGTCFGQDSVTDYSPLNDDRYTTFGRGHNHMLGLSVRTGTNAIQTALSVRVLDQLGTTKLSDVGIDRLLQLKGHVPSYARRPNALQQMNGDANLTMQSLPLFDVGLQVAAMHLNLRNNGNGMVSERTFAGDTTNFLPESEFLKRREENTDGYSAAMTLSTRQWGSFSGSGTFGMQQAKVGSDNWLRAEDCLAADCSNALGSRDKGTRSSANYSINSWGAMNNRISSSITLRSTAGLNYSRSRIESFVLNGRGMTFGTSDPAAAPTLTAATTYSQNATAGAYLEERLSIGNRLFMSGAVRRDVGSGVGSDAKTPTFPKFDLSWIASDKPITIPILGVLNTIRLRTSHGQSGHQPALNILKATLTRGTTWYDGVRHPVYLYDALGNSLVKPERTNEMEFGIDMSLHGYVEDLTVTYFRHMTHDAIVYRPVSIESGLPTINRMENLGKVQNTGVEATASFRLIDTRVVNWNLNTSFSQISNKVLSLGRFSQMPTGAVAFMQQRVVVGYPVYGIWAKPVLGYDDRNHDGALDADEFVIADSMAYVGFNQPKYTMTYRSSLSLWGGYLRLSSTLSQLNGFTKQAQLVRSGNSIGDLKGQVLDRNFLRGLQTVSSLSWTSADITAQLPTQLLRSVRARTGTFSVTGSNLFQWTNYRGNDPTVGPIGSDAANVDNGVTPNTRNWALRFSLTY